jgi:acyl-coenzyme A synthetase/AMP-(fatty) acid ligase
MDTRVFPPFDYSVTLPESVDFHRKHNPNETLYVLAEDGKPKPTNITFLEFGRAADRVAHYLRPGRGGQDRQVIAFVALSDTLLYQAVTIGIMRAGFIVSGERLILYSLLIPRHRISLTPCLLAIRPLLSSN